MSMKASVYFFFILVLAAGMILVFTACEEGGPASTENPIVKAEGATSASVRLKMGAGALRLAGGAAELMEGRFRTSFAKWKPEISYSVAEGKGRLSILQGGGHAFHFGFRHNDWDIRLNNAIPIDLTVALGAGENRLDLRGLDLSSLDVHIGAGEVRVDLRGPHSRSFDASINGGVGSCVIKVPRDLGIKAEISRGLGSVSAHGFHKEGHVYTNDAFGKSPVVLNLRISAGIGSIDLIEE
jgi:hypothetical protein